MISDPVQISGYRPMYKSGRASYASASLAIFAFLLLGACGDRPQGRPPTMTVVDDLGRELRVPVSPKRVISLAPSVTEVVFAAGAGNRLNAVTTADNYPPAVTGMDKITAFPLDHEGIVARNPDLILATDQINSIRDLSALSDLGIPSYFLRFTTVADVFTAVRTVGQLLGTDKQAERAADSLESAWMDQIMSVDTTSYRPTVLLLAGYDVLYAFGKDSYTNEIVAAAGGRSVTERLDGQAVTLSDEFVLTEQPELIVGTFGDDFDPQHIVASHSTWSAVPAVRDGRVYSINPDLISRPGPRVVDGARTLASWIEGFRRSRVES